MTVIRIGCGAGYANDRVGPAADLAERGDLHYLVFECLAERTLAFGQAARRRDPDAGYNPHLEMRLESVLPICHRNRTRIVTNMGSANPRAAGQAAAAVSRRLGLKKTRIAVIEGDDVLDLLDDSTVLPELGTTVGELNIPMICANAYIGAEFLLKGLELDPHILICGRAADSSLFLAPLAHEFGWSLNDWDRLAGGALVGHLLECSTHVTGGYFADPGYKEVPDLAHIGYPLAEVDFEGAAVITKLAHTGGCVTPLTVKEQLLYEVHDPRAYKTPDLTADFSGVRIEEVGNDRVAVCNAKGRARPDSLKVTVGFDGGFLAEAGVSYAGAAAVERAQMSRDILNTRLVESLQNAEPFRIDLIGLNSLHATAVTPRVDTADIRLHAAMRSPDRRRVENFLMEVESLVMTGPAGGGAFRGTITPSIITHSAFIDRDAITPTVSLIET